MPRTLSPTLAAIVEELELDQPTILTAADLRGIAEQRGLRTAPNVIAARLRDAGWLLPTPQRGVWEFAPGAHAGPIGHGEPTLPLRAALAADPTLSAALALATAAWALGFADRRPATLDVAMPVGAPVPSSLRRSTAVTSFTTYVGYTTAKNVPCHRPESVIAHLAASPAAPRSWTSTLEWLPDLTAEVAGEVLAAELQGRPRAVAVRAGYLLSGLRPDLTAPLAALVGDPVRFGPRRDAPARYVASWRVMDSLLPSDPTTWSAVR